MAFVFTVAEMRDKMTPYMFVPTPRVVDDPTAQKTLQAEAPPVRTMEESTAVMRVLPIWKTQESESDPVPARVSVPVMAAEDGKV